MKYLVIDVESVGLHGEGFAVGWVLTDEDHVIEEGMLACDPLQAKGSYADRLWVDEHCKLEFNRLLDPYKVRELFWCRWLDYKEQGAVMVADCGWPVEARFLAACVDDAPDVRMWHGPYPLLELASFLVAVGKDPLAITDRLEDELPEHNPLNDARQSARILRECLNEVSTLKERG